MPETVFPVVEVPGFTADNARYDIQYRRSAKWDPDLGDFIRDGACRVAECSGYEAYAVWCYKIAQTERYRCLAYPDSIGTEMERAMDNNDEKVVESMVQRTVTEALMVNPRTEGVTDFEFSWDGSDMRCRFKVRGVGWDEDISITI